LALAALALMTATRYGGGAASRQKARLTAKQHHSEICYEQMEAYIGGQSFLGAGIIKRCVLTLIVGQILYVFIVIKIKNGVVFEVISEVSIDTNRERS